ncbi:MAG: LysR family transcriptional regulator [Polaromonas sp.]|uniref:LysR family transcriptional regulator n=1 Tax=Polaromonas sp. TaxID=1869339 RepID=UPI0027305CC5|nr:LysR family transcriptional regulator [Polaromonas sp.]MDP1742346.1 LysR family transcriptional regulator [Polaromonas sp.]MDP3355106.1 LysR family transcriptional regulator [Polaromonas sp.]
MQRHITLKQFRYFLAVSEMASVAAAARMINIAQSAVTKSIQEIEESLGVALFERSSRGMVLTQAGHRFQASARKVISAVAEAGMLGRERAEALTGSLTIGVTSLVAGYYLADLFARFQRSHPSVRISVVEDSPQFLEHLLINGEVDLAIMVSNTLGDPQALVVEVLTSSPNRVWLASSHPLAERAELTLSECAAHQHIVLEADRIENVLRTVWSRYGMRPEVTMRTSSLEAVRSLVGVGAGIALLPDFLYRPWTLDAEHIEVRSLRDAVPSIDIGLVWRRGSNIRDVVSEFIELAREQSHAGRSR